MSPSVNAGRIEKNHLRIGPIRDCEDSIPRRLGFGGDDRDLLADETVQERGLSDVRPTDDRDESGPHRRRQKKALSGSALQAESNLVDALAVRIHDFDAKARILDDLTHPRDTPY